MKNSIARNLILAVDGSDHANAAVNLVCDLPLPSECQIRVISVLIPRKAQHYKIIENVLARSKEMLQHRLSNPIQIKLLTGDPAEEIIAYADLHHPDLIVLGARGLRSTFGILLGGVAQNVVEYATCPVLVVRSPYNGLQRILFATDGSEGSQNALQYLEKCPLPQNTKKFLIHVIPPEITADAYGASWQLNMELTAPIITEQLQEQLRSKALEEEKRGHALLRETIESLSTMGFSFKDVLKRGDAASEIIHYANEQNINLILVGSRGLSAIRSWLLGSVSRKLVHYSQCSVLIVKTPMEGNSR
jgi:nucleotide-binding universal stress UspA family protein